MSNTNSSPDRLELHPKPESHGRRLNRLPMIIAAVFVLLIGSALAFAFYKTSTKKPPTEVESAPEVAIQATPEILDGAQERGVIPAAAPELNVTQTETENTPVKQQLTVSNSNPLDYPAQSAVSDSTIGGYAARSLDQPQKDPAAERKAKLKEFRHQQYLAALAAPTTVESQAQASSGSQGFNNISMPDMAMPGSNRPGINPALLANMQQQNTDPNMQGRKQQFLDDASNQRTGYLSSRRMSAVSPYELKTGSVIPAVMITGINSDLPGEIKAQVSQNIYDTATGQHLLIPQGSTLFGRYSSEVSNGQKRALAVWTRVIYPDASTLDLQGMAGTDQAGYAGFADQVDNHYFKIFGNALLLSVITAGVQLSQPQTTGNELTAQQQVAGAIGQQMGQLGAEITKKNMDIQPTIKIRPGYRFNVMVNKDVVLEPY